MNKKIIKIIILIVAVALIYGAWLLNQKNEDTVNETNSEQQKDAEFKSDESSTVDSGEAMKKSGTFEPYSLEKIALAASGKVILFFHAPWCPICRGIESEINANPSLISEGLHILKVDYDSAISLRQKYGVTMQHTFVQVDANGNQIKKFNDAADLNEVLARVK